MYAVLLISCTRFEIAILLFKAGIHNGVSNSNSSHFLRLAALCSAHVPLSTWWSIYWAFFWVQKCQLAFKSPVLTDDNKTMLTCTAAAIVTCAFMSQLLQNEIKDMNRIWYVDKLVFQRFLREILFKEEELKIKEIYSENYHIVCYALISPVKSILGILEQLKGKPVCINKKSKFIYHTYMQILVA